MIVSRAPSGIPGLDALIQGGIPTNSTVALRAEASNATEYFLQQFISAGLKLGSPGIYCCMTRPPANVIKSMWSQGIDVIEQIVNDQLVLLDCYSLTKEAAAIGLDSVVQKKIVHVSEVDDEGLLQDGLSTAVDRLSNLRGLRAVCECVPASLTSRNATEMVRWGRKAFGELRAFDTITIHTFPIGVREELFNVMAQDFDVLMDLSADRNSERVHYHLNIQKMRLTEVPMKIFELETEGALLTLKSIQKIT